MKATIEIDATPQEMRELMGLPEVQSLQKEAMEKIRDKMLSGIESNDMSDLMKLYMPMPEQMSVAEGFQKTMWDAMTKSMTMSTTPDKGK
ncbi:MAG: hypothetical protein A6F70_05370 [Cycloclasticus sp. symbiont of Bathymodiolus heckerae]|nr:MAG: hypothetical protein A6F70_05370 [Cycloclasticus sp. symbiont of Bathymodiolus heckerae]